MVHCRDPVEVSQASLKPRPALAGAVLTFGVVSLRAPVRYSVSILLATWLLHSRLGQAGSYVWVSPEPLGQCGSSTQGSATAANQRSLTTGPHRTFPAQVPRHAVSAGTAHWQRVGCYLAAWGAPRWRSEGDEAVFADLTDTAWVQAYLSAYWQVNPLRQSPPRKLSCYLSPRLALLPSMARGCA